MSVNHSGTATIEVDSITMGDLLKHTDVKILRAADLDSSTYICLIASSQLPPGYNGSLEVSIIEGILDFKNPTKLWGMIKG
jgi:hypothetical protein